MTLKQDDSALEIERIFSTLPLHGVPATKYQDANATKKADSDHINDSGTRVTGYASSTH